MALSQILRCCTAALTLTAAFLTASLRANADETAEPSRVRLVHLDIPEATVRSRQFRARSLLRESLAREIDLAERDLFEFGGTHCDQIVARVLSRV